MRRNGQVAADEQKVSSRTEIGFEIAHGGVGRPLLEIKGD